MSSSLLLVLCLLSLFRTTFGTKWSLPIYSVSKALMMDICQIRPYRIKSRYVNLCLNPIQNWTRLDPSVGFCFRHCFQGTLQTSFCCFLCRHFDHFALGQYKVWKSWNQAKGLCLHVSCSLDDLEHKDDHLLHGNSDSWRPTPSCSQWSFASFYAVAYRLLTIKRLSSSVSWVVSLVQIYLMN